MNVMPPWAGPAPPTNVLVNDAGKGSVPDIAQKEPSIAVFGRQILIGWNDRSVEFGRTLRGIKSGVGHGFSTDGGATFTDAGEVGASNWGADPTVAVDRSGNFYFGRFDLQPGSDTADRVAVSKSTDGGATFPVASTASNNAESTNDGPMIVVDTTASSFSGNVYASWATGGTDGRFSRSTDGGASFSAPIALPTHGMPAVGPNGEVYVLGGMSLAKSTDGGRSFGPAVQVASAEPIGQIESATKQYCGNVLNGSVRAGISSRIAVDTSGGPNNAKVYVVYGSHGAGDDGANVYLTRSRDGGATWSTPFRLNDDATTNDQWLPFVAVAPNGSVAVSWYDRRLDDQNMLIDLFMRISTDGGTSFGQNLKITDVSFPPPAIDRTLGFPPYTCYFSSYNWITSDADNFYLVWTDDRRVRSSMIDPNIFFAKVPVSSGGSNNYEGLWWQPTESGWGVNIAQQGDILFATWFTYDIDGSGLWLAMSNGAKAPDGSYSGTLYRTTGPAFSANPWNPAQVTVNPVGTATFAFTDSNNGTFTYTVSGTTQSKPITRQIFSSPVPTCSAGSTQGASPNYQDLWWRSPAQSESGWGVNITHQGDTLFATWFTYDVSGKGEWLVMSNGAKTASGSYSGALYRTTGPAFSANPWNPSQVTVSSVGSATFSFSDANNGAFAYSVDGISQAKPITRQVYSTPATTCR
jgi:hypothetical protein